MDLTILTPEQGRLTTSTRTHTSAHTCVRIVFCPPFSTSSCFTLLGNKIDVTKDEHKREDFYYKNNLYRYLVRVNYPFVVTLKKSTFEKLD